MIQDDLIYKKFNLTLLILFFISLLLQKREVFALLACGLKLETALNLPESIELRAARDMLPVQASFKHGSAGDWQSICAPLFSVSPLGTKAMQKRFTARIWSVGPCLLCRASTGGQILRRTPEHISVLKKFVVISRYLSGHVTGTTESVPFGVRTGDIAMRDFARPFEALQYPSVLEVLIVPHRILGIYGSDLPALRVLNQGGPDGAPLRSALSEAFECLERAPDVFSSTVLDRLLACAKAGLTGPQYPRSIRRSARVAQRAAIYEFIEANLGRLDLSAELILPQFGVSRATLYRIFEPEGGVRKYIVDRRLFRALSDISDGGMRRGTIQKAAKRWGFSSAANFNRSVQQVFGGTPGALFRPPRMAEPDFVHEFGDANETRRDMWASF